MKTESSNEEIKLDYIRFRCTEEEKELCKKLAKSEHINMSAYLVRLIYAEAEKKGLI